MSISLRAFQIDILVLFIIDIYFRCYLHFSEGLAVGVGFAAINKSASATFQNARYLLLDCDAINVFIHPVVVRHRIQVANNVFVFTETLLLELAFKTFLKALPLVCL